MMSRSRAAVVGLALLAGAACAGAQNDAAGAPGGGDGTGVAELPLVEVTARRPGRVLAVMLSGDGNWAEIDREVAATLADSGVAVVGLKTRSYLLDRQRTPAELARDVARVLDHYLAAWQRDSVVIVGYSRGADLAPFVANRLPAELRGRVTLVAMIALAPGASFEFHWSDLVRDTRRATDIPTLPELEQLHGVHMLCIYGRDEPESACRDVDSTMMRSVERAGGHHLDGDYRALGALVVKALRSW
ncbi:MAG: AcvB/VirJ family lysyl-phosphatidylglycerol hydrolase [Gemmatimonadaceae bacterium]